MAKESDLTNIVFEEWIRDKLTQPERGRLLAEIFWAHSWDVFNTEGFDGNEMEEDIRIATQLIIKRDKLYETKHK